MYVCLVNKSFMHFSAFTDEPFCVIITSPKMMILLLMAAEMLKMFRELIYKGT